MPLPFSSSDLGPHETADQPSYLDRLEDADDEIETGDEPSVEERSTPLTP